MARRSSAGDGDRDAQLGLFGAAAPEVEPAAISPEVISLAERVPPALRMGTSSWSFPGWTGITWRGRHGEDVLSRAGLPAYARHPLLRAVGLDRTFYAPLPPGGYAAHAAQVPEGFRFLVKASQLCTTPALRGPAGAARNEPNPRFLDPGFARDAAVAPAVEGLGERLGVLLFQFPPLPASLTREPARFAERLAAFLSALPRGTPCAVEIRNASLLGPDYGAAIAAAGVSHAFTVHPTMPPLEAQARVAPVERQPQLVVRWMLGHGRGYEEARDLYAPFDRLAAPDPESRSSIAGLVRRAAAAGRQAMVIVNNKAEGSSPLSVIELAREIAKGPGGPEPGR